VEVVPEMIYRVRTTEPLSPTDGSPFGPRQYWQVSEASLDGDRIHARLASTGIDWMSMGPDGLYRPDVRAAFVTDDDAVVLMTTRVWLSLRRRSRRRPPRIGRRAGTTSESGWL
jgi:hypothetical protein